MLWLLLPAGALALYVLLTPKSKQLASPPAPTGLQPGKAYRVTLSVAAPDADNARAAASSFLAGQGFLTGTFTQAMAALSGTFVVQYTGTFSGGQSALQSVPPVTVYSVAPVSTFAPPAPLDLAQPVQLQPGVRYLAKATVTAPLSWAITKGAIQGKLAEMGFNPVSVYSENPPAFFPDTTPAPSGDTYWIVGDWASPATSMVAPSQLAGAWAMQPAKAVA